MTSSMFFSVSGTASSSSSLLGDFMNCSSSSKARSQRRWKSGSVSSGCKWCKKDLESRVTARRFNRSSSICPLCSRWSSSDIHGKTTFSNAIAQMLGSSDFTSACSSARCKATTAWSRTTPFVSRQSVLKVRSHGSQRPSQTDRSLSTRGEPFFPASAPVGSATSSPAILVSVVCVSEIRSIASVHRAAGAAGAFACACKASTKSITLSRFM
mmetsp:Transcript_6418/g.16114  ORF Transcript_6418/g.16114 Transcript_6418/m.16114 type:complete len:212 (-) Transcript_6418:2788-3423(-)